MMEFAARAPGFSRVLSPRVRAPRAVRSGAAFAAAPMSLLRSRARSASTAATRPLVAFERPSSPTEGRWCSSPDSRTAR